MKNKKIMFNVLMSSLLLSNSLNLYAFPTEPIDDTCGPSEPPIYDELLQESPQLKTAFSGPISKDQWFTVGNCGSVGRFVGVPFTVSSNLPSGTRCSYRGLVFEGMSSHAITSYSQHLDMRFECTTSGVVETVSLPIQLSPIAAPTLTKQ